MGDPVGRTGSEALVPEDLSPKGWAPFGWLPVPDTDPADGRGRLSFAWDDVHVNLIGHRRDEVPGVAGGLRCEILFRHATHTQALVPLDVPAVIVVAPDAVGFGAPGDVGSIRAFMVPVLSPIVLHRGTWHWGPYPVGAESVQLFNVQGLRYREDNDSVDLAARGMPVDVLVD
ncbi:MAG TPA: ureidoglycolate lyase [Acidimicrobiales bacterium]|nr:ureidoglycolate lyase [Acidimicrobiales bacterium]